MENLKVSLKLATFSTLKQHFYKTYITVNLRRFLVKTLLTKLLIKKLLSFLY